MSIEYDNALKSALNILNFADNTEKKLREKLTSRGHSRKTVNEVVEYLKRVGYLDDSRFIRQAVNYYASVKLYGRIRIKKELFAKGFSREDVDAVDYDDYDLDFVGLCGERIEKTASRYKTREALVAALARYGYTYGEIKSALSNYNKNDGSEIII